jgi:hypothetical protein
LRGLVAVVASLLLKPEETIMKALLVAAALSLTTVAVAHAQYTGLYGTGSNPQTHSTSGYTRSNGTYVRPYVATNPNNTQRDNFGTRGNYNPYSNSYRNIERAEDG